MGYTYALCHETSPCAYTQHPAALSVDPAIKSTGKDIIYSGLIQRMFIDILMTCSISLK